MLNKIVVLTVTLLMLFSFVGAASDVQLNVEFNEGVCSPSYWIYGDPAFNNPDTDLLNITSITGPTWVDGTDGRLALTSTDGSGSMVVNTLLPSSCICVQFASDSNEGNASIYIDGNWVWEGDTDADDVPLRLPLVNQTMRYVYISGLDYDTHTIEINQEDTGSAKHVTVYKVGFNGCQEEIPEFPTVALPIAAVIGLAFIFQQRREE
ncbi:hypothetical protein J2755_000601 [Methanohalophilus levihalophilus]|uniref:PEF-CTERM sorting domain-containing protein n=1 Tax=Methanohalophilus levihalophilus TaxID=1431282 RepID=UPI001FD8EDFA|nr:PEF-CTERM sorting domain-containing protein [Methanohalophilus levihalophilus]MBP2029681.1 hypothetical protein [Methanohalophilus levihalophilus]